jgi:hypothetical protein
MEVNMKQTKTARNLANAIYSVGMFIVLCLGVMALFGSSKAINPEAMIPFTWRESAFIWLAAGCIPMLLACMAVYKFNDLKASLHKKRNFTLIFLPGFICAACVLYFIGVLLYAYILMFSS